MSLAAREGQAEEERKNRVFASRKKAEAMAEKELHYQRLITENIKLKEALCMAKGDIEDWTYSQGDSPQSTKVIELINKLI